MFIEFNGDKIPRSSLAFADQPPTLPFHHLLLLMHYSRKYQSFTHSLIHYLKHLSVVVEESESTQIHSFFFLILFKWNILKTIDPDSCKKEKKISAVFQVNPSHFEWSDAASRPQPGKKAWGNLPFNLTQRSIWSPGWTDSILEVKCHCKLVLLHKNPLQCIAVTLLFTDLMRDLELKRYDLYP